MAVAFVFRVIQAERYSTIRVPGPGAFSPDYACRTWAFVFQMRIRSISSNVISSLVRSYSFVVLGDAWAAMRWACSKAPPQYAPNTDLFRLIRDG